MRKLLFSISVFLYFLFIGTAYADSPLCSVSVDVSTPTPHPDEEVTATVNLTNKEDFSGYVGVDAYLCREDDKSCEIMGCNIEDSRIHLEKKETTSLTCSAAADNKAEYFVKVIYETCSASRAVYSSSFKAYPLTSLSTPGYLIATGRYAGELRTARDVPLKLEEVERVQYWSQTNVTSSPGGLIFVLIFLAIAAAVGMLATKLKFGPIKLGTPKFRKRRNEAECFHGDC